MAKPNFSTPTYVNPYSILQKSLSNVNDTIEGYRKSKLAEDTLAATQAQNALDNSRADARLKIQQDTYKAAQEERDRKLAQEASIANISKDYLANPSADIYGASSKELDQKVIANMTPFIPDNTKFTQVDPESAQGKIIANSYKAANLPITEAAYKVPNIDQKVLDNQTALQAQYDNRVVSQNDAQAALTARMNAAGVPIAQSTAAAKALTSGLVSDADRLKANEKSADTYNKNQMVKYKKEYDAYIAGKRKGKGYTGDVMTAISKITPKAFIGGDRTDALDLVSKYKKAMQDKGFSAKDINKLLANGVTYSSGTTDWFNSDVEFHDDMFTKYMNDALLNDTTKTNALKEFDDGVAPALPTQRSGSDLVRAQDALAVQDQLNNFDKIVSGYKAPSKMPTHESQIQKSGTATGNTKFFTVPGFDTEQYLKYIDNNETSSKVKGADKYTVKGEKSNAYGRFQIMPDTASQYFEGAPNGIPGVTKSNWKSKDNQIKIFNAETTRNITNMNKAKIPITPKNVYMAHQQGFTGMSEIVDAARNGTKLKPARIANIKNNLPGSENIPDDKLAQAWLDHLDNSDSITTKSKIKPAKVDPKVVRFNELQDRLANTPKTIKSTGRGGARNIPNPEYARIQEEFRKASPEYLNTQIALKKTPKTINTKRHGHIYTIPNPEYRKLQRSLNPNELSWDTLFNGAPTIDQSINRQLKYR